jgi:HAD superfamily hydrolase (TIGR01662 family)
VAHGRFAEEAIRPVEEKLRQLLAAGNVPLQGFYYCPHHPDGAVKRYAISCFCRKPNPGMIFQAAREHGLNLAESWFVGDILNDVEAGQRAGCRTVLIDNGNETEWRLSPLRQPHHSVSNLMAAANVILLTNQHSSVQPRLAVKAAAKRPVNPSVGA